VCITKNTSYEVEVLKILFQSIQGNPLNLKHKLSNGNFDPKVVGSTPRLAKFERDLGGFSPEFCMGGKYTNGDASSLLCPRVCFLSNYSWKTSAKKWRK